MVTGDDIDLSLQQWEDLNMAQTIRTTIELKYLETSDGTLPLPIISIGGEQGLSPEHAARVYGMSEFALRRFLKVNRIETSRVPASGIPILKDAGVIASNATSCRFISRAALYLIAKAIGGKAAMEAFASIWRAGRPFDSMKALGKVLTTKSMLEECFRRLNEQEERMASLEVELEKLNQFLMDTVTLEVKQQESL